MADTIIIHSLLCITITWDQMGMAGMVLWSSHAKKTYKVVIDFTDTSIWSQITQVFTA